MAAGMELMQMDVAATGDAGRVSPDGDGDEREPQEPFPERTCRHVETSFRAVASVPGSAGW